MSAIKQANSEINIADQYVGETLIFQASPAPIAPTVDAPTFSDITSTSATAVVNFTRGSSEVTASDITLTFSGGSNTPTYDVGDIQEVDKSSDKYNATISINSLVAGTTYSVTATVKNNAGLTNTSTAATLTTPRAPTAITIDETSLPTNDTATPGRFTAVVRDSSGIIEDSPVSWTLISGEGNITIDSGGNYTVFKAGSFTVKATADDVPTVNVTASGVIVATPATVSFTGLSEPVTKGQTGGPLTATVLDKAGNTITDTTEIKWELSKEGIITLTTPNAASTTWTAVGTGEVTITLNATAGGVSNTTQSVTVTVGAAPPKSIEITNAQGTITDIADGTFTYNITYSDDTYSEDAPVIWSVSPEGNLTIDSNGKWEALSAGEVKVTVAVEGAPLVNNTASIIIVSTPVTVSFTGLSEPVTKGQTGGPLTATVLDKAGNTITDTTEIKWELSKEGIITLTTPNAASTTWTAVGTGTVTITLNATAGGVSNTTQSVTVTVGAAPPKSIEITNAQGTITDVADGTFTYNITYSDDTYSEDAPVTWSVSPEGNLTIDSNGKWEALSAGEVKVTVAVEGAPLVNNTASIIIVSTPVTVSFTGLSEPVTKGDTESLTATVLDKAGNTITDTTEIKWELSKEGIITLTTPNAASTTWTAVGTGTVTITLNATAGGVSNTTQSVTVTVGAAPPKSIEITNAQGTITDIADGTFTYNITYSDDTYSEDAPVIWSVSPEGNLTIDSNGKWEALSAGKVKVTVAVEGAPLVNDTATIIIVSTPATVSFTGISGDVVRLTNGTLTPKVFDRRGTDITAVSTLEWIVEPADNITIDTSGSTITWNATKVGPATITLNATANGVSNKSSPTSVTVTRTVTDITIGNGPVSPTNDTAHGTFSWTVTYSDGTSEPNGTVTWTSTDNDTLGVDILGNWEAKKAGKAKITATTGGFTKTTDQITIVATPDTIEISPLPLPLKQGDSGKLIAVVKDKYNVSIDTPVTWGTDNSSVITIDQDIWSAVAKGTANITATATSGDITKQENYTVTVVNVPKTVEITGIPTDLRMGGTASLGVIIKDIDGTIITPENEIIWTSKDTSVFTVTTNGLVTPVAPGTANITVTVTALGVTVGNETAITVKPVAGVTIDKPEHGKSYHAGVPIQFNATVIGLEGNPTYSWNFGDNTQLSPVQNTTHTYDEFITPGFKTVNLTVFHDGGTVSQEIEINITKNISRPVDLEIQAAPSYVYVGKSGTLKAIVTDQYGIEMNEDVIWTSSSEGAFEFSGNQWTSKVAGSTTITGTAKSNSSVFNTTDTITIVALPVADSVVISGAPANMSTGSSTQLGAVVLDTEGTVMTGQTFTWTSSDNSVISVTSDGTITARSAGKAKITATSSNVNGEVQINVIDTTPVRVLTSIAITDSVSTLYSGDSLTLGAVVLDQNGVVMPPLTVIWSSSNTSVATVDPTSGLVTASGEGSTMITATVNGIRSAPVTINVPATARPPNPVLTTVTISPAAAKLYPDESVRLTAIALDDSSAPFQGVTWTWSSSNEAAATVNSTGFVTAVAAGSAEITAVANEDTSKSAKTTITVDEKPVFVDTAIDSVSITGGDLTVLQGTTGTLKAIVLNAGGILLPDEKVTWASGSGNIVAIDPSTGVYRALETGDSVTITATSVNGAKSSSITITVLKNPDLQTPKSITITAPSSMTPGQTATAAATVYDQNGYPIFGETVIWTSSSESIISVSTGGTLTAKALGSATITAKLVGSDITGSIAITVANTPSPYVPTPRPTSSGGGGSSDSGYSDSTSAGISGTGSASFGSSIGFTGVIFSRGTTGTVILGTNPSGVPTPQNCYLMRDISAPQFSGSAEIQFSVPIAFLQDRGLTVNDVVLKHYVNGNWLSLPTFYLGEERGAAKYVATTGSFSPFAIVYEQGGASTVQKATPQPTASSGTAKTATPTAAATSAAGQQPGTSSSQTTPVTGTAAPTAASPTLTQAPVPVAGMILGLLAAASLIMRRRE